MSGIKMPPEKKTIKYPAPKAEGGEDRTAKILARAHVIERYKNPTRTAFYCRILDRIKWEHGPEELRFAYYYCTKNCTKEPELNSPGWVYGQGSGNMRPSTFLKLIRKAKISPDYGHFGGSLRRVRF